MENEKRPRVVLVIRSIIRKDDGKILLVRRSNEDSHLPGIWEFPGGKIDEGQNLLTAQIEEIKQETGLEINPTQHYIRGEDYIIDSGRYSGFPYIVLVGLSSLVGGELVLSKEHDNSKWIASEADIEGLNTKPEVNFALSLLRDELGWDN